MGAPAPSVILESEDEPSRLVAPIWHTILVFGLLFWLEYGVHPRKSPIPRESLRALLDSSSLFSVLGIVAYFVIFALLYLGLVMQKSKLRDLLGPAWGDREQVWRNVWLGARFSVVLLAVSLLFTAMFRTPRHDADFPTPKTVAEFGLFFILLNTAGIVEELMFRGYLMQQFSHYLRNQLLVVIVQAVAFAALHGPGQNVAGATDRFVFGGFVGLLAIQRKSLLPGMVAHCCLNSIAAVALFFFR